MPEKIDKYCTKCNQIYTVSDYVSKCPICKTRLNHYSQSQKQNNFQQQNVPKCPTCSSTNIKKLSDIKRAVHGYAFGLFSKTARSQFECKNCGYKW